MSRWRPVSASCRARKVAHALLGRVAEARQVLRDQRPGVRDQPAQDLAALGDRQLGVALADVQLGEDLVQRAAVDLRVLAHVQAGEVEAEDLDLADHVVQVARGGGAARAQAQGVGGRAQVPEQLLGPGVGAGPAAARGPHARDGVGERAPVGLLGVALAHPLGQLGEQLGAPLQHLGDGVGAAADPLGVGQALGQYLQPALQERQAAVAHQVQRLQRHLGRHVRVAVAVAADPGAEAQQRGHRHAAGVGAGHGGLQVAVDPRHGVGQRGLEVDDAAAHLVDHRQRGGPQLVRAPQLLHGRAQPVARGLHGAGQVLAALVQQPQLGEHAGQLLQRGPAAGLGGVRGQHQPHLGLLQQLAQLAPRWCPRPPAA